MAARPNALRTLEYGQRLVSNHLSRLESMLDMVAVTLEENKTLTPADVAAYKACYAAGKKQLTQFRKIQEINLPDIPDTQPRRRGRPTRDELTKLAVARGEKRPVAQSVTTAVATAAPKRRGRPPKNKPAEVVEVVEAVAPKRRGRKPKSAEAVATTPTAVASAHAGVASGLGAYADVPVKKKRGRPKGSKNKPKIMLNGQNTDININ